VSRGRHRRSDSEAYGWQQGSFDESRRTGWRLCPWRVPSRRGRLTQNRPTLICCRTGDRLSAPTRGRLLPEGATSEPWAPKKMDRGAQAHELDEPPYRRARLLTRDAWECSAQGRAASRSGRSVRAHREQFRKRGGIQCAAGKGEFPAQWPTSAQLYTDGLRRQPGRPGRTGVVVAECVEHDRRGLA